MVTLTVMTCTILAALDMSIVNVALPNMRGSLSASVEEITWVATGYMLSSVLIMPMIAMLSTRFGRKNLFVFCVVLFTLSSILCGLAWNLFSMILFRVVQGIGGGALIPISQAILRETFPPEEQAMAMSIYGLGVILGPALGPSLGGWLTDNYSWPWIFYINVPIGLVNILMILRYIEDPHYLVRARERLDLFGLLFMSVGLGALQIMLEKGETYDWFESAFITELAITSAVCLILFVWRELRTEKPAVDLTILRDINFASGTLLSGLLGMGLFGSLFLVPLFLQQLLGYPAFDSGLTLLPRTLSMALAMPIAGRLYNILGPRFMIGFGLFLNGLSFVQFSLLALNVGFRDLFLPQALQGFGFGFIFVSISTAALATIDNKHMTAATGLYNVIRQVFASVGIALSASFLTRGENWSRAILSEHVTVFTDKTQDTLRLLSSYLHSRGMDAAGAYQGALKMLEGALYRQSSMLSYNHVFFMIAVLFFISIPLIFFLKNRKAETPVETLME